LGLKGLFFTIDAIIALLLIVSVITTASIMFIEEDFSKESYLGTDLITIFSNVPINQIKNDYFDDLISEGSASGKETVFEIIGKEYADGHDESVTSILNDLISDNIKEKEGISIFIEDELVFHKETTSDRSREVYKTFVTGIEKNKPVKGFISRAVSKDGSSEKEMIIPINTQGSAWNGFFNTNPGRFILTKNFEIGENITILEAELKLSLEIEDYGDDWTIANLNDGLCEINKSVIDFSLSNAVVQDFDIKDCLVEGDNKLKIEGINHFLDGRVNPGTRIYIKYIEDNVVTTFSNERITEKYYFNNIESHKSDRGSSGVWQTLSFNIPEDATNLSGSMEIHASGVRDQTSWFSFFLDWDERFKQTKGYDYLLFFNDDQPYDIEGSPNSEFSRSYDITDELRTNTNVATVYFNNYGYIAWGNQMIELHGNPSDSDRSHIEISYDLDAPYKYGAIKLNKVKEFNDGPSTEIQTDFSFPNETILQGNVFVNLVQRSAHEPTVYAEINDPPLDVIYRTDLWRAVPASIFIPKIATSLNVPNYVRVKDKFNNYAMPDSAIYYEFYIPLAVPFGDLFNTSNEANEDAINRLKEAMGSFYNGTVETTESSITDVPTLWGPLNIEVRIWK